SEAHPLYEWRGAISTAMPLSSPPRGWRPEGRARSVGYRVKRNDRDEEWRPRGDFHAQEAWALVPGRHARKGSLCQRARRREMHAGEAFGACAATGLAGRALR